MKLTKPLFLILFLITSTVTVYADDVKATYTKSNGCPYYIMVNRKQNTVTVYTIGEDGYYSVPVKAMVCSTGRRNHNTPLGTFSITNVKKRWCLMFDGTYGQYSTQFYGNYLFHSICYRKNKPDSLLVNEYNDLGNVASLGCVRLQTEDAKWIFDNCQSGTLVTVYDGDSPGALGKPNKAIEYISEDSNNGWDPTDPLPENPWHKKRYIFPTSARVYINGYEIPSFLHKTPDQALIAAEDLKGYGFDVRYDQESETVVVTRNREKAITPIPMGYYLKDDSDTKLYQIVPQRNLTVVLKDGETMHWCDVVYRTDGYALINIDELSYICPFVWNFKTNAGYFELP